MRFSYLPPRRPNLAPSFMQWISYIEASPRMQYAFVACAFAVLLCSFLSLWENSELRVAELRYERAHIRLETVERSMTQLRTVTDIVERLGRKAHVVAAVRGRTAVHVQDIEELGDHVAHHAWLVALHEENGTLHLRGRARSAADVGETLAELRQLENLKNARLDSLHALDGNQGGVVEFDVILEETTP